MSAFPLTRRQAMTATLASAVTAALSARFAAARPAPAGGVRVDVGPLLGNSGEPTAGWVARTLPEAIAAALAASGQPGPVSVRIDYVILGSNTGGLGPGGSSWDQMLGEVTRGGETHPLRASTAYYPNPVDNTMIEQSNYDRVVQLCRAFAGWVAKGY